VVTDFFGNFLLALLLVGLLRFLYAVCALLVRTRDGGNIVFAIALPAVLLYIVVRNPVPVSSWTGLAAGAFLGALLLAIARWRQRRS
jgi:hypothetical protein